MFILKTLSAAFGFVLLWNIFLTLYQPPIHIGQNQGQDNVIRAQNYVYSGRTFSVVILGSSMAARLGKDAFRMDSVYNLAIGGGSALTGMEIIRRSGHYPKMILIEANVPLLSNGIDNALLDRIFPPLFWKVSYRLPFLLEKNQPITVLENVIYSVVNGSASEGSKTAPRRGTFDQMMAVRRKDYRSTLGPETVEAARAVLERYVCEFMKQGIAICFFEMPYSSELSKLPKPMAVRETLLRMFPRDRYRWVEFPDNTAYETTDGLHLSASSAKEFGFRLERQVTRSLGLDRAAVEFVQ